MCFYKYCNCDYEPNIKLDLHVIKFVANLPSKKRRNLKLIKIRKHCELDFLYHENGIIHESEFYWMDLFYHYKGERRAWSVKFKLDNQ